MQSSAKIKVTHILTDSNIGGAGRLLRYFLEKADRERFEYSVILPDEAELIPEIEALGIPVITAYGIADRSSAPEFQGFLTEKIKNLAPDILHTHSSRTGRFAGVAAGVPHILLTKHCSDMPPARFMKFPMKQMLAREWKKTLQGAIATDDSAADAIAGEALPRDKIKLIYNGAPELRTLTDGEKSALKSELGIPEDAFVVGIFARLEKVKDHFTFIDAARSCIENGLDKAYFLIVGDGSRLEELKDAVEDEELCDRIKLCGFASDIAPLMNICNVNVNCSVGTETSNLALIEGMSLGVVPVVSDLEGNKRIAKGCGIVCKRGDGEDFADAIASLYNDGDRLGELSAAAKEKYLAKYTSERMAREVEEYYLSLLK
jgi:glycosyltransferase involved in cell wall biosynthesis